MSRLPKGKQIRFNSHPVFSKWGKPNIYGSGKLYDYTLTDSKSRHRSTGPAVLTYNPSLAARVGKMLDKLNNPTNLIFYRHIVEMADGGRVGVDEISDSTAPVNPDYPNIIFIPGGASSSYSAKAKIRSSWFLEAGHPRVFVVNRRCSSKIPQYSPQITLPYGRYNDIPAVMDHLVDMMPQKKWIIIGTCFGAQLAIDYLAQTSSCRSEIIGGILDSFQFDHKSFLDSLYNSKSLLVKDTRTLMTKLWIDSALNNAANQDIFDAVSQLVDRSKFKGVSYSSKSCFTLAYDELICKLCHDAPFSTVEEFFAICSPYYNEDHKNFLNIQKPVTLILSHDDPLSPLNLDTIETLKENSNLCLWLYPGGGHTNFTEKIFPYTSFIKDVYLENALLLMRRDKELKT